MSTTTPVHVPASPMTLGGIFSTTFAIFRRRLGLFIGLTAMPVEVTLVVAII